VLPVPVVSELEYRARRQSFAILLQSEQRKGRTNQLTAAPIPGTMTTTTTPTTMTTGVPPSSSATATSGGIGGCGGSMVDVTALPEHPSHDQVLLRLEQRRKSGTKRKAEEPSGGELQEQMQQQQVMMPLQLLASMALDTSQPVPLQPRSMDGGAATIPGNGVVGGTDSTLGVTTAVGTGAAPGPVAALSGSAKATSAMSVATAAVLTSLGLSDLTHAVTQAAPDIQIQIGNILQVI
jgi:hypothetical protein